MKNIILLSSVACLFFWSCKPKDYMIDNLPNRQITFGEGGGFTGKYTTWMLLDSGQIFQKSGIGAEFSEIGKLKYSQAKKFYKRADAIAVDKMKENRAGNYNYELILQRDSVDYKAGWANEADVDSSILNLYKVLRGVAIEIQKDTSSVKE
ncbi:MAG: hypothetical protein ACI85O_002406 [Saprospiraceae bacterium]|jgi:hypothetical protein